MSPLTLFFRKSKILLPILSIILSLNSISILPTQAADQIELNLSIDKSTGSTDDLFTLTLSLQQNSNQNNFSLQNTDVPGLENFQIIANSNTTNIQIINGSMKAISEKKFSLKPQKDGTFTLGPVKITTKTGNSLQSNSLQIHVTPSLTQQTKNNLLNSLQTPPAPSQPSAQINSLQTTNPSTNPTPLPQNKIQTINYTNRYFWIQILGSLLLFGIGLWLGNKFLSTKHNKN